MGRLDVAGRRRLRPVEGHSFRRHIGRCGSASNGIRVGLVTLILLDVEMSKIVVMAHHKVLRHFAEEFSELVRKHAQRCVESETGCLQFSVSRDINDENRWCYYELYATQEDFDTHCSSPH